MLSAELRIGKLSRVNIGKGTSCKAFTSTSCSSGSFAMLRFRSSVYLLTKLSSAPIRPINATIKDSSSFAGPTVLHNVNIMKICYQYVRAHTDHSDPRGRNYILPCGFGQEKKIGLHTGVASGNNPS